MHDDPDYYCSRTAGYWIYGLCSWIGTGWCNGTWHGRDHEENKGTGLCNGGSKLPHIASGRGINRQLPQLCSGSGINRKIPQLGGGCGINRHLPHISAGQGINRQVPSNCESRREFLIQMMGELSDRMRDVRVCCGDWKRIMNHAQSGYFKGNTAIFLDPPYQAEDRCKTYAHDDFDVGKDAAAWAIEHGHRLDLRIAYCGYEGSVEFPPDWVCVPWKANGGYSGIAGKANENRNRERIWFSPGCLKPLEKVEAPQKVVAEAVDMQDSNKNNELTTCSM
jgi:hypothetical protein